MSAMDMFDQGQVGTALEIATVLLVPALKSMSELQCPGDDAVMERVREDWCNCLTHPSLSGSEFIHDTLRPYGPWVLAPPHFDGLGSIFSSAFAR